MRNVAREEDAEERGEEREEEVLLVAAADEGAVEVAATDADGASGILAFVSSFALPCVRVSVLVWNTLMKCPGCEAAAKTRACGCV